MAEIDDSLEPLCEITPDCKSVASLCSDIDAGLYVPAHHQRPCRWPSRLFELLILTVARNLPLAPIHLCEHPRGPLRRDSQRTLEINDGGHRLRGIFAYRNNEFPITLRNGERVYYSSTPSTPGARRSFTSAEQLQIMKNCGYKCALCQSHADVGVELDHIVPLWKGGTHSMGNAQVLCVSCHADKTAAEATERAQSSVGTPNDRVMTGQERSRFDNYPVHIVTYKNYTCPAADVHRIIFRQVQNGVAMDANDKIFAQAANPFVKFIERRLAEQCKTLTDMCRIIKNAHLSSQDFWDITKSRDNIYKVTEALFRGMIGSERQGDTYVPGPCSLKGGNTDPQCHMHVTRDEHLRPFELLLGRATAVFDRAAPACVVRYEDFAVVFHACHADPAFADRAAAAAQQRRTWLPAVLDDWAHCRSLQPGDIQAKMAQLQSALAGAAGTDRAPKRRR